MRAKILFLSQNGQFREDSRLAQQALSELALAFSHSFVMREMELTEDLTAVQVMQAVQDQDAVILSADRDTLKEAAWKLGVYARSVKTSPVMLPELSRLRSGAAPCALLISPVGESASSLNKAAVLACALAKKSKADLFYIPKEPKEDWQNELNKAAMYAALPAPVSDNTDGMLSRLLYDDKRNPAIVAPGDEERFLRNLLIYLSGTENLVHQNLYAENRVFQAVSPLRTDRKIPLFSILFATVDAVRYALKLEREADCLMTVISNVLSSGWRTNEFPDASGDKLISEDEVLDLIAQQVQLAGELYERLG
ncbi:MAG: hypothetical protein QM308_04085 [Bacillota bacterium]|nr:hypothetical protein [Bacillota bacterium]